MTTFSKIDEIRYASRTLVRELGFMSKTLADTSLSPSATHSIIEIGLSNGLSAKELSVILKLEKSSISRLVQKLIQQGLVLEAKSTKDKRQKELSLTEEGKQLYQKITLFGRNQASSAIQKLNNNQIQKIIEGLSLYAGALSDAESYEKKHNLQLVSGYFPGLIGQIIRLHGSYYTKHSNFGIEFESLVAKEISCSLPTFTHTRSQVWSYLDGDNLAATITIEENDENTKESHIRWFIADEEYQGFGLGHQLMETAINYCDHEGFDRITLSTFSGLDAAKKLYMKFGFQLVTEFPSNRWGKEVLEQHFERTHTC